MNVWEVWYGLVLFTLLLMRKIYLTSMYWTLEPISKPKVHLTSVGLLSRNTFFCIWDLMYNFKPFGFFFFRWAWDGTQCPITGVFYLKETNTKQMEIDLKWADKMRPFERRTVIREKSRQLKSKAERTSFLLHPEWCLAAEADWYWRFPFSSFPASFLKIYCNFQRTLMRFCFDCCFYNE